MAETDDWRLTGQDRYLQGEDVAVETVRSAASRLRPRSLRFCSKKFGDFADALNEGWTAEDECHWVCDDCQKDFQQMFALDLGSPRLS